MPSPPRSSLTGRSLGGRVLEGPGLPLMESSATLAAVIEVHAIHRVTGVGVIAPYTLRVSFDDGVSREIDFLPVLAGEVYGPLRDEALFNAVTIDCESHTLVWPNGADFDPAMLHDWPQVGGAMREMAKGWR